MTIVDGDTRKEELVCVVPKEGDAPFRGADITVTGTLTAAGELDGCALAAT